MLRSTRAPQPSSVRQMLARILEPHMRMLCELQLYNEHQALEREFCDVCPKCKMFPADGSGHQCYHCCSIGGIMDECPKCNGKPWSEEFLAARQEIAGDEKDPLPS